MSFPALYVSQLSVNYDKTPVLWDISLEVPKGKLVAIVGPNGAGKSTFVKAIMGLVKPISGRVEFFGKALRQVRTQIAYVPQRQSVDWDFPISVKELTLMGRYGKLGLFHRPRKADYSAAEHNLEMVGMLEYSDRQISQLSGGQQQRVFFARALMQGAEIYFFDEPLAGIDAATEKVIMGLLKNLIEKGKTVFVVHHDLNTVKKYFDWVIMLNMKLLASGNIQEAFTPDNLYATYGMSYALLDEALKISQNKNMGLKP